MNDRQRPPHGDHEEFLERLMEIRCSWSPSQKADRQNLAPEASLGADMLIQMRRNLMKVSRCCRTLLEAAEIACRDVDWMMKRCDSAVSFTKACEACDRDPDSIRREMRALLSPPDWAILKAYDRIVNGRDLEDGLDN